jgi:hypothetical protein
MEVLDKIDHPEINKKPNTMLHVMCILGYIANGFWVMLSMVILIMGSSILPYILPDADANSEELIRVLHIGFTVILIACAASIVGLILAHQKKKSGVIIYGIANGLWALVNLISLQPANLIFAVISIAFIIVIAINHNK